MNAFLDQLRARREFECRLTADRALGSLDEAHDFLRDRGMLTRTTDGALPSLYEACHEEAYQPGGQGFASWPATKWPWAGQLGERPGVHKLMIHNGKNILLTDETLALVDPICRSELVRMENADPGWERLLTHLGETGPSLADDVRTELRLKPRELKAIRAPLERCGALVSRWMAVPGVTDEHMYPTELARWDQAYPGRTPREPGGPAVTEAVIALVAAAVRAAVLAPEREVTRWFSWRWLMPDDLVDRLVASGQVVRPAPGWVAGNFDLSLQWRETAG